jgi:hypothetical protein
MIATVAMASQHHRSKASKNTRKSASVVAIAPAFREPSRMGIESIISSA